MREFGCGLESLEDELDFLSTMIVDGYTLLSVYLMDVGGRIDLPVGAFDGLPLSVSLRALRDEWEDVLYQPTPESLVHRRTLIDLVHRRIDQHHVAIAGHEKMICYLENWHHDTQKTKLVSGQQALLRRYERMIVTYQQCVKGGQIRLGLLNRRLRDLTAQ